MIEWILFMLKAVKDTAVFTRERTLAIRTLMNETTEKVREKLPTRVYSKELIETIFSANPIPRADFWLIRREVFPNNERSLI